MGVLSDRTCLVVLLMTLLSVIRLMISWELVTTTILPQWDHSKKNDNTTTTTNTSSMVTTTGDEEFSWVWIPEEDYYGAPIDLPGVNDTWTPRAWLPVTHRDWCYDENTSPNPGLIYIKIPKASSSTMAAINIRLARSIGSQVATGTTSTGTGTAGAGYDDPSENVCSHTYHHAHAEKRLGNRKKTQTVIGDSSIRVGSQRNPLVWTFLRDPAARQISAFFHFRVSRRNVHYDAQTLIDSLQQKPKGFTYNYIKESVNWEKEFSRRNASVSSLPTWYVIQRTALEPYNFIGLLERRDESLAVMKLLWNLTTADVIVLSSKSSGGYDDGRFHQKCTLIQPAPRPLPAEVTSYIENDYRQNNVDYLLYDMVNATLDKTIQRLGVNRVAREVQQIQRYQRIAEEACLPEAVFPCSANGTRQREAAAESCYDNDFGCGHACVDRVLASVSEEETSV